jgi:hypothetical protein
VGSRRARALLAGAAALAGVLVAAAPAAASRRVTIAGADGPGSSRYDRVFVNEFGPASAKRVLVLMPGYEGGAGDFTLDARWLVDHVPGLQVWAIDRRSQALERSGVFERALAGRVSLKRMFDHYLGWIANGGHPADHFQFLDPTKYGFVKRWGLSLALKDERKVVLAARDGGRRQVVLGGHSLGGSMTVAYASWSFNGHPGYRDVDGLVLIDGGLLGSFDAYRLRQARAAIAKLDEPTASPFSQLLGRRLPPEAAGLFVDTAAIYALRAPAASAAPLQSFPLLPRKFNPPFTVTVRALLAHAFDRDTSPASLGLLHVNAGHVAARGNPRDWVDGGVTPVANLARTFGQEPSDAVEWYFPDRLRIDTNAASALRENAAARFLGLHIAGASKVDVPVYAIQTDLTNGAVLRGARRFVERARTTTAQSTFVNADPQESHLDPLTAAPARNRFLQTVVPFLHRAFAGG